MDAIIRYHLSVQRKSRKNSICCEGVGKKPLIVHRIKSSVAAQSGIPRLFFSLVGGGGGVVW